MAPPSKVTAVRRRSNDGTGGEAGEPTVLVATADADDFDPGEHTVAEVQAYVAEHPDSAEAIATAEAEGKARTTLLGALEARARVKADLRRPACLAWHGHQRQQRQP